MNYAKSKELLAKAEKIIPLGAQTFSKTKIHYACEAPRFLTHGEGALVYDVDGNEYVDLVGGLGCNILGYCDDDLNRALRHQIDAGHCFSLATELEYELARRLHTIIPSAEMVRFGKSGTDATTGAIRLARYFTGRMRIVHTGYHGWGDWSICSTNSEGVPRSTGALSDYIAPGNVQAISDLIKPFREDFAAIIIDVSDPRVTRDYLLEIQQLCGKCGILLIFDEVLSAFRFHLGGAQTLYNVTPDISCLGKSMANGMPLSAICGRRDVLKDINQPGVFYSGTYFGETLSLAAAIATIDKLKKEGLSKVEQFGRMVADWLDTHTPEGVTSAGHPSLLRLNFIDRAYKAEFQERMLDNGVLINNAVVPSLAHGTNEWMRVKRALEIATS